MLVQPLIVTELLFALPISVRWQGMRMSGREWLGTGLVTSGLALGLLSAAPGQGRVGAPLAVWGMAMAGVAVLALAAAALGRLLSGAARPSLFALAAALVLGAQAALLKATIGRFEQGLVPALADWHLWAMVAASILGLLLVQSAYESGPLATSMPVVDAVDPAVGILFGIVLFHESVRGGAWRIGIFAGAALLLAGIVVLDTSPLVQCLQRLQRLQRGPGAGEGPGEGPEHRDEAAAR